LARIPSPQALLPRLCVRPAVEAGPLRRRAKPAGTPNARSDHEDRSGRWSEKEGRRRRTLPPGGPGSTIRAAGFHFRVRDGIGWIPRAIATGHKGRVWVSGVVCFSVLLHARGHPRVSFALANRWTGSLRPVKPHGPLVRLGCSARAPCTCRLSTWWSPTALQGSLAPGKIHLWRGFPLRCVQRLSRPDLATRHCRWHDNRYTRGRSVPVLSY
jgi:hypothetical protein